MSEFRVRPITTSCKSLITFVEELLTKVDLRPCFNELETVLELDPSSVFVGELNGKPIGCVSYFKYNENLCVGNTYAVENEYRGKSYGMKMFNTAMKSVLPSQNLVGYGVDEMMKKYVEKVGFQALWSAQEFLLQLPTAFGVLNQLPPSLLYFAKTIDDVDFQALYDYDTKVFGYPRKAFLQKFLRQQGSHARVAVDTAGNIVGYTAARVLVRVDNLDEGYRLGPLFAESSEIAKVLLKALFGEMLEKVCSSSLSIVATCPVGRNAEAKRLMGLLEAKEASKMKFMSTKGIPNGRFDSLFVAAGSFLG